MKIKTGDTVLITNGKKKKKKGKVLKVLIGDNRLVVEGVNILKKHAKPTPKHPHGGVVDFPGPITASNAMVICSSCGKPTRIGHKSLEDGSKIRVCRRCQAGIDAGRKAK